MYILLMLLIFHACLLKAVSTKWKEHGIKHETTVLCEVCKTFIARNKWYRQS